MPSINSHEVLPELTEEEKEHAAKRRLWSDKISSLMGRCLLKGWRMLGESYQICGTILFKPQDGDRYCVACSELDMDGNSKPAQGDSSESGVRSTKTTEERIPTFDNGSSLSAIGRNNLPHSCSDLVCKDPVKTTVIPDSLRMVNTLHSKLEWCVDRLPNADTPDGIQQWARAIQALVDWGSCIPEPVEYEGFITKNKISIASDPHRELLLCPTDDIKLIRQPKSHRIANAGTPPDAFKLDVFASNPLGRHSVNFLATGEWICVQQASVLLRGHYWKLPRISSVQKLIGPLSDYWFSVDQCDQSVAESCSGMSVKHSPIHPSTYRPWTTAVMPTRSRQPTLDSIGQNGEFNRTTEGSSSAEALQVSKLRGLRVKSRSVMNGRTDTLSSMNDTLTDGNVADQICVSCDK
ncbi:uncharacterized protein DEA37_0003521, partial [Paragonimus westermani]